VALNEWGFAAEVKSWWDTALAADASELDQRARLAAPVD
jgi:hypothetical protein